MARSTLSVATLLILTSLSTFVHAAVLVSRASQAPGCATCPPQDGLGFALGQNSDSNGVLFCSYPAVEGEDPNDFYCTYNDTTGQLIEDHDADLCPRTAGTGSCVARRDDNFKAMKRRQEARAAMPQSSRPQARSKPLLRKKKRAN